MLKSGVYYSCNGDSLLPKDLLCLAKFDESDLCVGVEGFKRAFKAPADCGLILRVGVSPAFRVAWAVEACLGCAVERGHLLFSWGQPRVRKRSLPPEELKGLCFANREELGVWHVAMRVAKYGAQLRANYEDTRGRFQKLVEVRAGLT